MNFPKDMETPSRFIPTQGTCCQAATECSLQGRMVPSLPGVIKLSNPFLEPLHPDKLIVRCWNQQVSKGLTIDALCQWGYSCSTSTVQCSLSLVFKPSKPISVLARLLKSIIMEVNQLQQTHALCIPESNIFFITIHWVICHKTVNSIIIKHKAESKTLNCNKYAHIS